MGKWLAFGERGTYNPANREYRVEPLLPLNGAAISRCTCQEAHRSSRIRIRVVRAECSRL